MFTEKVKGKCNPKAGFRWKQGWRNQETEIVSTEKIIGYIQDKIQGGTKVKKFYLLNF